MNTNNNDYANLLKSKCKSIKGLSYKYGYLTDRFSLKNLFPSVFLCKNFKCNAEFRIISMENYKIIREDPICVCGYPLIQYELKDEIDI